MKSGALYIQNVEYTKRVVDLRYGKAGSDLIGYPKNRRTNQKWTFTPVDHVEANQYELSCITTAGDKVTQYAKLNDNGIPVKGDNIDGSDSSTVWTVVVEDDGKFRISVKDKDGNPIYWTLLNEEEGTEIILEHSSGADNQYWTQESD